MRNEAVLKPPTRVGPLSRLLDLPDVPDGAAGGTRRQRRIGPERLRDVSRPRRFRSPAAAVQRVLCGAAAGDLRLRDSQIDRAVRDVDLDPIALFDEAD